MEADDGVVPIEVKSGKSYKRHVALNNLLASDECDIDRAYVLSETNVAEEQRNGATVWYLPLYMLPLVAKEARGKRLPAQSEEDIDWASLLKAT